MRKLFEPLPNDGAPFKCGHWDHMEWKSPHHVHDGTLANAMMTKETWELLKKLFPTHEQKSRAICNDHMIEIEDWFGED